MSKSIALLVLFSGLTACSYAEKPRTNETNAPNAQVASTDTNRAWVAQWQTDFDKAVETATSQNLPLFVAFTGSDWCHYCKVIAKEVFEKPLWYDYARERFVLVYLDFPLGNTDARTPEIQRNTELKQQFAVDGFPTFVMLAPDGTTILKSFGMSRAMNIYAFLRETGRGLLSWGPEAQSFIGTLPQTQAQAYIALLAEIGAHHQTMQRWLDTQPLKSKENIEKLEAMQDKRDDAVSRLIETEVRAALERHSEQATAPQDGLYERSKAYIRHLAELDSAVRDLDNWLLSRPRSSAAEQHTYEMLLKRLEQAYSAVEEVRATPPLEN